MALEPQMSKLMSRLEWTWRLVMTGLCFALFGLGGLLLSVVWFSIAASFRLFLTVAKGLGVLDYRIDGAEILRQERGCLVVANHPTLIDYVLLASVMPETDCLVKSALLKNPFLGGVVRAADYLNDAAARGGEYCRVLCQRFTHRDDRL